MFILSNGYRLDPSVAWTSADLRAFAQGQVNEQDRMTLCAAAAARRNLRNDHQITFSPKIFLPITNLCRNRCDYCTFRRSPGDDGAYTMTFEDVARVVAQGAATGCTEALLCLGDKPEKGFSAYRRELAARGLSSTVDHLVQSSHIALKQGVLPHTNAGVLDREDMVRLRPVNASMGLMLESSSERLCEPGMPHHKAPDKRPEKRIQMMREAGELQIPFTSGILVGIGETRQERIESLLVLRDLHAQYGHIQELIIQNFRAKAGTPMASSAEPTLEELLETIAMARLIMPLEVSIQAPPNLSPHGVGELIGAGINDLGGISPITPDFINPERPWPHLHSLRSALASHGWTLSPRLPIYDEWIDTRWVDPSLRPAIQQAQEVLHHWWDRDATTHSFSSAIQDPVHVH